MRGVPPSAARAPGGFALPLPDASRPAHCCRGHADSGLPTEVTDRAGLS